MGKEGGDKKEAKKERTTTLYLPFHPTPTRHRQLHNDRCTWRCGSNWSVHAVVDGRGLKEEKAFPAVASAFGSKSETSPQAEADCQPPHFHESVDNKLAGIHEQVSLLYKIETERPQRNPVGQSCWDPSSSHMSPEIRVPQTPISPVDPRTS